MVNAFRQPIPALLVVLAGLFAAVSAHAQYKYVGPDGRVVYSDQPPPPNIKPQQKPATTGNTAGAASSGSGLPYALQQATKTFPVTLYTTDKCDACDQGRALLAKRGVPYAEKTVRNAEDFKVFKDATAAAQVPVLMVGSAKQVGFDEAAWNSSLSVAGYPPNNLLPPSFRNAPAAPAAPPTAEAKGVPVAPRADAAGAQAQGGDSAPPAGSSAPGPQESANKPPSWFKGF